MPTNIMRNLLFQLSLVLFSVLYLMVCPCLCHSNSTMSDGLALLAFKYSVRDPYNHLGNWSNSASICDWSGITCDFKHERVRILSLPNMGLKGSLPSQIGNLSFLVTLDLNNNNFYGKLPKELLQLQRLEILNLSHNAFNGEIPIWIGSLFSLQHLITGNNRFEGIIPPSISNLSKLETLDLNSNSLQGSIPFDIGRLQHLKILRLSANKLSGIIPPTISNMSSLEWLSLSFNLLQGHIPIEMNKLKKLKMIYLGGNQLTGKIPSIGNLIMLQELYLAYNNLQGNIPNEIRSLTNLKFIDVSNNQLFDHIPRGIGNLTMVQDLILNSNDLEGSIPMEIGNIQQLETLWLNNNKLSESIPSEIFNISTLKDLSLSNNSLSGSLPSDFGIGLSNLQSVILWGNKLYGKIPNTISNASKLSVLELEENNFGGVLPRTLGHLRYLKTLQVHGNNFTTIDDSNSETGLLSSLANCRHLKTLILSINPLHMKLPKSIGNLSHSLETLAIDSCGINGNIPSEIGNLSTLITLSLSNFFLNGSIPTTISHLQDLQYLNLFSNELDSLIVDELCDIKSLAYLYLLGNKFSGPIPSCIGNLVSLEELELGSNKLISEIPSSFWNLEAILKVNLSSNMLFGNLSYKIGNMKSLILLDLSRNHFSGIIPTTIGSLQNLQNLSLAHNMLQGTIPESLGNSLSLVFLDFSENNLSGEIPKSLELLRSLVYVNLSYNQLQGEIPSGGIFKNLAADSFMMNKALCGGQPKMEVPPCRKEKRKRSMAKLILLKCILPLVLSTILVVLGIILFQRKRMNLRYSMKQDLSTLGMPIRISYSEILDATNRFDESNLLGKGNFGSVFKGRLSCGKMVAIKIFNFDSEAWSRSFEVECDAMRNVRHRNLVKIISCCSNNIDFKCLIMEFIPNGSLEKWLYSHNYCLDFLQRLNIMIDIASALEYLHHGLSTPIVHYDLKPSNILLDDNMVAHLTDFGIAKFLNEGKSRTHTETIPTIGYVAPEYGSVGVVSTKVDVYSYGIILMEIFTRKRPTEDMFVDGLNLRSWVSESMSPALLKVIDSNLLQGDDEQYIDKILTTTSTILELALNCCADCSQRRCNMLDVVVSLNKIKDMFMQTCHYRN